MKKITLIVLIAIVFVSCEKSDITHPFKKENKAAPCAVVNRESLNATILSTFKTKYPNATGEIWFNKDNTGFVASFTLNGNKTLALFNNDGSFANEEMDTNQDGDHQDNTNDDKGCSCDIEDED